MIQHVAFEDLGSLGPILRAEEFNFEPGVNVLHWHGDTFDLPMGAIHLASSQQYENQAFSLGQFGMALQFHAEVTADPLGRWYIGHAAELAQAGIAVPQLRNESRRNAHPLENSAAVLWKKWFRALPVQATSAMNK